MLHARHSSVHASQTVNVRVHGRTCVGMGMLANIVAVQPGVQERVQPAFLWLWLEERYAPGICAVHACGRWGCRGCERLRAQLDGL